MGVGVWAFFLTAWLSSILLWITSYDSFPTTTSALVGSQQTPITATGSTLIFAHRSDVYILDTASGRIWLGRIGNLLGIYDDMKTAEDLNNPETIIFSHLVSDTRCLLQLGIRM